MDEERLASELKGNTQRVYWCLLSSKNNIGVRQLQRKLGFSSPALAVYHLEKLVELGLVEKVHGEYHLAKIVDVGVLKQFIKLGGVIIPQTSAIRVYVHNPFHIVPFAIKRSQLLQRLRINLWVASHWDNMV